MLSAPPFFSRWNCSALGVNCGTTPQKLPGSASAGDAVAAAASAAIASAASEARSRVPKFIRLPRTGLTRLRRDGGAGGAAAALPDHHSAQRDRRQSGDRDQDRRQRRRSAAVLRGGRLGSATGGRALPDRAVEVLTLLTGAAASRARGASGIRRWAACRRSPTRARARGTAAA